MTVCEKFYKNQVGWLTDSNKNIGYNINRRDSYTPLIMFEEKENENYILFGGGLKENWIFYMILILLFYKFYFFERWIKSLYLRIAHNPYKNF